jgi:ABC-type branched-subunit amino acid transport system permease subunit
MNAAQHTDTASELPELEVRPPQEADDGRWRRRLAATGLVAACLLWVMAGNDFGPTTFAALLPVLTTAAIYATAGVGLNLQFGHGGLLNFGFVAFMAVGGYTAVPWGQLLRAFRDDEDAVRSLGKRPTLVKLQALMIGGAVGGLSGALLAFQLAQLNPDIFLPQVTFFVFTIVILGGTGSTWGPMVGGIIFWVLLTESGAFAAEHVGSGTVGAALRYILVGVLMVLLINFRPQGILGRRENVVLTLK